MSDAKTVTIEVKACPKCGHDADLHEFFRDGRCPVVRLDWKCFIHPSSSANLS